MTAATRVQPQDIQSSQLLSLARIAMADSVGPDGRWSWPTLDFADPAQRRFGDYELLAELGRGGMGVVYRARQLSLDREVALKFIAAGLSDTHQVTRFVGEARAAARLVHPNIVAVFEVGSVDEIHYFSMPLIAGESLEQRLQRGPIAQAELLRLLLRVAEACRAQPAIRLFQARLPGLCGGRGGQWGVATGAGGRTCGGARAAPCG